MACIRSGESLRNLIGTALFPLHDGHLVGIVSLRDILLYDLDQKDEEVPMMHAYIHSTPDA